MADHDHVSPGIHNVRPSHDCWLNFVPGQYTRAGSEPILVALAGPCCLIATCRYIPPDQRLSISGAVIRAAVNDAREQKERAANKKRSDVHAIIIPSGSVGILLPAARLRYNRITRSSMFELHVGLAGTYKCPRAHVTDRTKTATTEPNRILSPSFNSASVMGAPLICVPFVDCKSLSR